MNAPAQIDRNGLEVLDRDECLRLLGTSTLGRIGISHGALPLVLPVNYRLVGDRVVFRTAPGTKLDAATAGAVVAFEVDDIDRFDHAGWSVVVTGTARSADHREADELEQAGVPCWGPNRPSRFVVVSTDLVSGRRLRPGG